MIASCSLRSSLCATLILGFSLTTVGNADAQEAVSFASTDVDLTGGAPTSLTGYLYKPQGHGPFAAVVALPGCDGPHHPLYEQWGDILAQAGYLVLLVDSFEPRRQASLMGEADNWVSASACKALISRARQHDRTHIETHYYPGAYHAFDHPGLPITVVANVRLAPDGHSPTVGSDPLARADAIKRVQQFLAHTLR